jgi:hypothetical protein
MYLTALTKRGDVDRALAGFSASLKEDSIRLIRTIGWLGGHRKLPLYWHPRRKFWFTVKSYPGHHWCSFGTMEPTDRQNLNIDWQLSLPPARQNHRFAGAFVRDENGREFAAHSGKVGGGRKGIGKSAFLEFLGGSTLETVHWPDGSETQMLLVAELGSPRLIGQLVEYTERVKTFKLAASKGHIPRAPSFQARRPQEFFGKKVYKVNTTVVSRCDHGRIIDALSNALHKRGLTVGYDRARDLYTLRKGEHLEFLFEAKTDTSPGSLYRAIGQLLVNGRTAGNQPMLVLVLPAQPKDHVAQVLEQLNIQVVTFTMKHGKAQFFGLEQVLL